MMGQDTNSTEFGSIHKFQFSTAVSYPSGYGSVFKFHSLQLLSKPGGHPALQFQISSKRQFRSPTNHESSLPSMLPATPAVTFSWLRPAIQFPLSALSRFIIFGGGSPAEVFSPPRCLNSIMVSIHYFAEMKVMVSYSSRLAPIIRWSSEKYRAFLEVTVTARSQIQAFF